MTGQAGLVNAQRPEIRRSWERSRSCGIDPEADIELPYDPELTERIRTLLGFPLPPPS